MTRRTTKACIDDFSKTCIYREVLVCDYCRRSAQLILINEWPYISPANVHWGWRGLLTFGFIGSIVALGVVIGLVLHLDSASGFARTTVLCIGAGLSFLLPRILPVRALACDHCRKVIRMKLGRNVPMHWKKSMKPIFKCVSCGYCILGLTDNRCPECGEEFPVEWNQSNADVN
jgi:hypothetical protein